MKTIDLILIAIFLICALFCAVIKNYEIAKLCLLAAIFLKIPSWI
jgi:hypothetical protein